MASEKPSTTPARKITANDTIIKVTIPNTTFLILNFSILIDIKLMIIVRFLID